MTTFLKLLLTALTLNACVQAGRSAWTFYRFEDSVHQAVLFSAKMTPQQLEGRILQLAAEHQVPVDPETLSVTYAQTQATITGSYVDAVPVVPGAYTYRWEHTLDMDVRRVPY